MKSGFLHHFYFWMLRVFFSSQILPKLRHSQAYVFVVQKHWAGVCQLPFDGSVMVSLTVGLYDGGEGNKIQILKSSHLFYAETCIYKPP